MTEINNRIKKILEHFRKMDEIDATSYQSGINADRNLDEAISLICQLFPQPLDEGLKVLVDGEWVEASEELKKTVRSIEKALPDKELREKIAECLNWYSGSNPYIDWHRKDLSAEDKETKKRWRNIAQDFVALLQPKIEEARRQGARGVVERIEGWGWKIGRNAWAFPLDKLQALKGGE